MKRVLQIEQLRKRVVVSALLDISSGINGQEVWFLFDEGVRLRAELSISLRNPRGQFQIVFIDCESGSFDLDERLQSHIGDGKPGVEIQAIADSSEGLTRPILIMPLKVNADIEFFGTFDGEHKTEDQSVMLVIDGAKIGTFTAYETDVRGGSRRMNVAGISVAVLEKVAAALRSGIGCELVIA